MALTVSPPDISAQDSEPSKPITESATASATETDRSAEHRFDLGLQRVDTPVGDFITTLLNYTAVFRGNMSFSAGVTVNRAKTSRPTDGGTVGENHFGLGDSILIYSFLPDQKINAQPWVPRSLGFSVLLVVPTGNAQFFLGGDQFVIRPQMGWVLEINDRFSLLPAVRYTKTFAHGDRARPAELLSVELGAVWVNSAGWWFSYTGEILRNLERSDWLYDDSLSVGKMFGPRIGFSVGYGILEDVDPNATRDDSEWILIFHYVMSGNRSKKE